MKDIDNWIRLAKLESPKKAIALVDHFGSVADVFAANVADLSDIGGIGVKGAERIRALADEPVDREIKALEKLHARIVTYWDADYPVNLRQISDPPAVLFVHGELREEDRFSIAVIGTRRASEYGRSMATKISRDLAKRGLAVVSGGARGIDTAAHTAALQAGRTIAVLGSGLDIPYPYENRGLFAKIAENGAVISEFAPGTKPEAWRFPVRNRVVSGLTLGVLVIESQISGGAMITATLASEQGREVWALPGATDNSTSSGPHLLIKEGAKLVENAEDILADLGIECSESPVQKQTIPLDLSPEQKAILGTLSLHPKYVDEIILECNLSPAAANSSLTLLEMLGLVRRVPGNCYVRAV